MAAEIWPLYVRGRNLSTALLDLLPESMRSGVNNLGCGEGSLGSGGPVWIELEVSSSCGMNLRMGFGCGIDSLEPERRACRGILDPKGEMC